MSYEETKIYFVDQAQHCILVYQTKLKQYGIIAGKCNKPGNFDSMKGDRVGKASSAYFNGPSSVAYWKPDPDRSLKAYNGRVFIVKNESCSIDNEECLINN